MNPILERVLALIVTVAGVALTAAGALAHLELLKAPGALAIAVGAAWLGVALARQSVILFPAGSPREEEKGK